MGLFQHKPSTGGLPAVDSRVALFLNANQTGIGAAGADVILNSQAFNIGGWTVNLGTGEITVPAGITHVNVALQHRGVTHSGTIGAGIELLLNGSSLGGLAGYDLSIAGGSVENSNSDSIGGMAPYAAFVPVSSGDVFKMRAFTNTGTFTVAADFTWLYVEKAA